MATKMTSLKEQGKYLEAAPYAERFRDQAIEMFGADHNMVAQCNMSLGQCYYMGGEYERAVPALLEAVNYYDDGKEKPKTLSLIVNWLAESYDALEKVEEAEKYYKMAVELSSEALGAKARRTGVDMSNLAEFYGRNDRPEEAEVIYEKVLENLKQDPEAKPLDFVVLYENRGLLQQFWGMFEEAEKSFQAGMDVCHKEFGMTHLENLRMTDNLGSLYLEIREYEKAELILTDLANACASEVGKNHTKTAYALAILAELYLDMEDLEQAQFLAEKAIKVIVAIDDESSLGDGIANYVLGSVHRENNRAAEAEECFIYALDVFEKKLGTGHRRTAHVYHLYGTLMQEQSKYEDSEKLLIKALDAKAACYAPGHPEIYNAMSDYGNNLADLGKFEAAEGFLTDYHDYCLSSFEPDDSELLVAAGNLGSLYHAMGEIEKARKTYEEALTNAGEVSSGEPVDASLNLYTNLASLYSAVGEFDKADELLASAVTDLERSEKQDPDKYVSILITQGNIATSRGGYKEAKRIYQKAVDTAQDSYGKETPLAITALFNLSTIYNYLGDYADQDRALLRCMELMEGAYGPNHPDLAAVCVNRASLFVRLGQNEEAQRMYAKALEINESIFGEDHYKLAANLYGLGLILSDQGKLEQANKAFVRAMELLEDQEVDQSLRPLIAASRAQVLADQSKEEEAEKTFELAIELAKEIHGPEHERTAHALLSSGHYYAMRDFAKAADLFEQAVAIYEKENGDAGYSIRTAKADLALTYHLSGEREKALELGKQALELDYERWRRILTYFSERECLVARAGDNTVNLPGTLGDADLMVEEQIRLKGAVLDMLSERRRAAGKLAENEQAVEMMAKRENLANRFHRAILEKGQHSKEAAALRAELESTEKQIADMLETEKAGVAPCSIGPDEVRSVLPADAALVEMFRYEPITKEENKELHYASVLLKKEGEAVFIPHGPAAPIEEAIETYREIITVATAELVKDEERVQKFREAETALYDAVIAPIEEHLGGMKTVILSPGDQLHFIPLAFLRDGEKNTLLSKYDVRYVTSGRDLVTGSTSTEAPSRRALLLGDAVFENGGEAEVLLAENSDAATEIRSGVEENLVSATPAISFVPLPGTRKEVEGIEGKLAEKDFEVVRLTGEKATESALDEQCQGASIVHLATHGFILDELVVGTEKEGDSETETLSPRQSIRHPMYVSGLALTSAQDTFSVWAEGKVPDPVNDGVVLAAEMAELDLSATELVVLSACDTGAGTAFGDEGVLGIRQALNTAGARNIILTLWPVGDQATVEIMSSFYDMFLNDTPAFQSLTEAQKKLYPKWEEEYGEVNAIAFLAPFLCTSSGFPKAKVGE